MSPAKAPATRVKWTKEEIAEVAAQWVQLCTGWNQSPLSPKSLSAVAKEAQKVLPPNRQRQPTSLQGHAALAKVLAEVKKAIKKNDKLAEEQKAEALEQQAEREQAEQEAAERRRIEAEKMLEREAAPYAPPPIPQHVNGQSNEHVNGYASAAAPDKQMSNSPTLSAPLEELVHLFGQRLADILVGEALRAIRLSFKSEFPKLQSRTLSVSKVLPRILVIGPLPKQQPFLEEAVDGLVDLKFVSSEESPKLVTLRGKSCVGAIMWTNFMSHSHQEAAKRLFDGDHAKMVTGGVDKVREAVEEIALSIPEM